MKRNRLFSFLTILVLLCAASIAHARTYYVATTGSDSNPGTQALPFKTIRYAVARALGGSTVQVASGTYAGDINISEVGVILKGAGPGQSIIDGGGTRAHLISMDFVPSTTRVEGFTLQNGNSSFGGSGIYLYACNITIANCTFRQNRAGFSSIDPRDGWGGAISNRSSSPTIINCTFDGNSGGNGGGAIANNRSSPTLINCVFINNTAGIGSAPSVYNRGGGAIFNFDQSSPTFINCTFTRNSSDYGGAMVSDNGSRPTIINSIFWGDSLPEIVSNDTSVTTVTYTDVQGGFAGTGNINVNPLFVNALGGNCRLQSTSPCINTANASAPNLPATDLDGLPRNFGGGVDMGAYETWLASYGLWFVDTSAGNDTSGTGSPNAPYRTVAKAYAVASNGHKLYIKAGNYGTDKLPALPRMTKSLRLFNWLDTGQARIGKP